jgi:hypothetical protein
MNEMERPNLKNYEYAEFERGIWYHKTKDYEYSQELNEYIDYLENKLKNHKVLHDVSKRTSLESKNSIILDINQWTQILLANRTTIRERPLWAMIADINNRTTD